MTADSENKSATPFDATHPDVTNMLATQACPWDSVSIEMLSGASYFGGVDKRTRTALESLKVTRVGELRSGRILEQLNKRQLQDILGALLWLEEGKPIAGAVELQYINAAHFLKRVAAAKKTLDQIASYVERKYV